MKKIKYIIILNFILLILVILIKDKHLYKIWYNQIFNSKISSQIEKTKNTYNIKILGKNRYILKKDFIISNSNNKIFTFELYGKKQEKKEQFIIQKIKIYEKEKLIQTINLKDILKSDEYTYSLSPSNYLTFVDINIDGYLDMYLNINFNQYSQPYVYWLYNKNTNKFDFLVKGVKLLRDNGEFYSVDDEENPLSKISYEIDDNNNLIKKRIESTQIIKNNRNDEYFEVKKFINNPEEKNYTMDISYNEFNQDIKIKIYGKNEVNYIPKKLEIYLANKLTQVINLEEIPEIKQQLNGSNLQDFDFKLQYVDFNSDVDIAFKINSQTYCYFLYKWEGEFEYLTTANDIKSERETSVINIKKDNKTLKYIFDENYKLELLNEDDIDKFLIMEEGLVKRDERKKDINYLKQIYKIKRTGIGTYMLEYDFFIKDNEKLKFKMYGEKTIDESMNGKIMGEDIYVINKIEVYKENFLIQTINRGYYAMNGFILDADLILEDINFDGYLDFSLTQYLDCEEEYYHYYFIWNKDKNKYEYKYELSGKLEVFDIENKIIIEKSNCDKYIRYYKFEGSDINLLKMEKYNFLNLNNKDLQITYYTKQKDNLVSEIKYNNLINIKFYGQVKTEILDEGRKDYKLYTNKIEVFKNNKLIQTINLKEDNIEIEFEIYGEILNLKYYEINNNEEILVKEKEYNLLNKDYFKTIYYKQQENNLSLEISYKDLDNSVKKFKAYGEMANNSSEYFTYYNLYPEKIEVFKNNKFTQTINLKDFEELKYFEDYIKIRDKDGDINFEFIDINFDGHLDIGICIGVGTFNVEYAYFLWNEKNNKFEYLTNSFTLEVAPDMEKTLYNSSKGDGFYDTYYKINENNELEIIKQSNIFLDENIRNAEIYKELKPQNNDEVIVFVDVANHGNDNDRKQLNIYNKKISNDKYGIYKIEVLENENVIQTILIEDTNTLGIKYAEYHSEYSSVDFFDFNSDGYLDMKIILYTNEENDNIYYYWLWDNNTKTFNGTFEYK